MPHTVYFSAREELWPLYHGPLRAAFSHAGLDLELVQTAPDPTAVDYMIYAPEEDDDLSVYTNLRLIQSLWAGPEKLLANPTLTQPVSRMVEPGMTRGMVEYVLGHVLRHHLQTDTYAAARPGEWLWHGGLTQPLAKDRVVGVLGVGELGMACAHALHQTGFPTLGWSRTLKSDPDIACFAGDEGLQEVLGRADILVLLVPLTPQTENLINAQTIAAMKDGAAIINPGRGPLIVDDALLAALDAGKLSGATLDVFDVEPLLADHRYWTHPKVLVTPHIASETRIETAAAVVAENIRRDMAGEPVLHLIDRSRSY